jgi:hypothetical protein
MITKLKSSGFAGSRRLVYMLSEDPIRDDVSRRGFFSSLLSTRGNSREEVADSNNEAERIVSDVARECGVALPASTAQRIAATLARSLSVFTQKSGVYESRRGLLKAGGFVGLFFAFGPTRALLAQTVAQVSDLSQEMLEIALHEFELRLRYLIQDFVEENESRVFDALLPNIQDMPEMGDEAAPLTDEQVEWIRAKLSVGAPQDLPKGREKLADALKDPLAKKGTFFNWRGWWYSAFS